MVHRHWIGDLGWAVLLSLPLAALAWSQPLTGPTAAPTQSAAAAPHQSSARLNLLG